MPRTNVVGTTTPPGSGAQRCALAGEREHRIDSTAGAASCVELRHYCRNLRCRSKLTAPVENHHHAFCCRGCHESFYLNRCRVCEKPLRKYGGRDAGRRYCRPPNDCKAEARKWPQKYEYGPRGAFSPSNAKSAHSAGLKTADGRDRKCLIHWRWGDPDSGGDHSLYDVEGLTVGRLVLDGGCYHLRTPLTRPVLSWLDRDEAKRGAGSFALMAMPLEAVDPKLAARIKRDNETPHPMGPPLNRPPLTGDATSSDWRPTSNGAGVPDIPDFLRRRPR
jgi:hypothetical protein